MAASLETPLSDSLISGSIHLSGMTSVARIREIHATGSEMTDRLATDEWARDPDQTSETLHALMAYSAIPCLLNLARNEPQTHATAQQVTDNLRGHYETILKSSLHKPSRMAQRPDEELIVGRMSELAVFGLVWWSIAHHLYRPDSYALPTHTVDDRGMFLPGVRNGYDLAFYERGTDLQKIQVKTSVRKRATPYLPDIAVIPTTTLVPAGRYAASLMIIEALASNDNPRINQASRAAKHIIRKTQQAMELPENIRAVQEAEGRNKGWKSSLSSLWSTLSRRR